MNLIAKIAIVVMIVSAIFCAITCIRYIIFKAKEEYKKNEEYYQSLSEIAKKREKEKK